MGLHSKSDMTEQLKQQNSKTFKPDGGRKRGKKEQKTDNQKKKVINDRSKSGKFKQTLHQRMQTNGNDQDAH